ncbi:MAG: glycosyltransferase [Chthoniobacterales bacterium]
MSTASASNAQTVKPKPQTSGVTELSRGLGLVHQIGLVVVLAIIAWTAWEIAIALSPPSTHHFALGMFGALGAWRYGWLATNVARAWVYQFQQFPKLRKRADALPPGQAFPPVLHLIIPTYREQPWVTERMLQSVIAELNELPLRSRLYLSTGSAFEDAIVRNAFQRSTPRSDVRLILLRQNGKRSGMAFALRAAARDGSSDQSCVVMMDGDTVLTPGILRKSLPFFALSPKLGAVTTNNRAVTRGPTWYRHWYSLRFSLRNRYMSSASLSRRVLTLTGRFSIFRGGIALSDEFISRLEDDGIHDWLYGPIKFKTGDDKSTWYTLLKDRWEMIYLPDVVILCMENAGVSPVKESLEKMKRWFGNMLRNNGRATALGPSRTGWFVWLLLVDQRISMWTSLILPVGIILLSISVSPAFLLFGVAWVISTRLLYLLTLAVEGHRLTLHDVPLLVFQQWVGSAMKILALTDLRHQRWAYSREDRTGGDSPWIGRLQAGLWIGTFLLLVTALLFY